MPVSRRIALSAGTALAVLATAGAENPAAAQASAAPFTTGYRYDVAGRVVGTISPDDAVGTVTYPAERITYGAKSLPIRVETGWLAAWQGDAVAPSAWTDFTIGTTVEFSYDSLGRKIQERRLVGGVVKLLTEFEYDAHHRLKCTAVRMDEPNFGSQPVQGCTPRSPGTAGPDRITRISYDNRDRITQIEKGVGTGDAQIYAAYTYNAGDRPLTVVDANGNKAELSYDGFERQTRWTFPSESAPGQVNTADYERYEYDLNGNRTLFRKRDESVLTFGYDALNRMTAKIVPERSGLSPTHTRDVHYAYDLRGLQTRARFDNRYTGEGVDSGYDGFGRLSSSTINMGGASRTLTYLSDSDGNRTRITHPAAIVPTHPHLGPLSFYYTYDYDGLDRPILAKNAGGGAVAGWTYDAHGRLETIARFGGAPSVYGYDPLSRTSSIAHDLIGSAFDLTLTFEYNPANQIASRTSSNEAYDNATGYNVSRPYQANGLNQYLSAGPAQFDYDANGNLTADGSSSFVYDVENRLVSASGAKNAALVYDPLGRLFQVSGGASGPMQFLYDGDALVAEYSDVQTRWHVYVHGPGGDRPMVWFEGGYGGRRLYADHQGSIVAIAHPTNAWLAVNGYDSWGIPNPSNAGRFQYTGQVWLPELGMYYYKARVYSPTLGRFMQTDPIGYEDEINLYAYVGNDPVNRADPFGLWDCAKETSDKDCDVITDYVDGISEARDTYKSGSREYKRLDEIINTLGTAGDGNGITIGNGPTVTGAPAEVSGKAITLDFKLIDPQVATAMMMDRVSPANADQYKRINGAGLVAHEVDHIINPRTEDTRAGAMAHEISAFTTQEMVNRNFGIRDFEHRPGIASWGYGETWVRQKALRSTNRWCSMMNPPC